MWKNFKEITGKLKRIGEKADIDLSEMKFLFLWLQTRSTFYLKENHLEKAVKIHLKKATAIKQFQNSFYSYIYATGFKSSQINLKNKLLNSTIFANGMSGLLFPRFSTVKCDFMIFLEKSYPSFHQEITQLSNQLKKQNQKLTWIQTRHLIEVFMIIASPTFLIKK